MTHDDLVTALREIGALDDVGTPAHPHFRFRSEPFLHFHDAPEGVFADVRFGRGDFERVWAATPEDRAALLARVSRHVDRVERARKSGRTRRRRPRDG